MRRHAIKRDYLLIAFLLVVALVFRLYKITTPLADLNSWHQTETAMEAHHIARDGFNPLQPPPQQVEKKDLSGPLTEGVPLYAAAVAGLNSVAPSLSMDLVGRATSIFFSLVLMLTLYYILSREVNRTAAFFASLIFAIFPFFVFFSRVVMPEMMGVSLTFAALFFLYLFAKTQKNLFAVVTYVISIVFFSAAILITPTVCFFLIAAAYLFGRRYQLDVFKKVHVYLYFFLVAAPFVWWYLRILPPVKLTAAGAAQNLQDLFFKHGFFKTIFFDRVSSNMLGGYLTAFLVLAIVARPKKYFLHSLLLSVLTYLFLFQGANISYEYYQILLLPVVASLVGVGIAKVVEGGKSFVSPAAAYPAVAILLALSFYVTYDNVHGYYNYSPQLPRIASILQSITESDAKIVTDTGGDTTLLYLSDRDGSPSQSKPLEVLKNEGYLYFVTLNHDTMQNIKKEKKYSLIFEDQKNFAVFKL